MQAHDGFIAINLDKVQERWVTWDVHETPL